MKYRLVFFLIFCSFNAFSQIKNEVEIRIDKSEFPEDALNYLKLLPKKYKHLKYFKETDAKKISYEAKFWLDKRHFSVEFDENGILEDIEIVIKKRQIPKPVLKTINIKLKNTYKKHRFLKIQKQYKNTSQHNNPIVLKNALQNTTSNTIYYEIITEVKYHKKRELLEITFSKDGDIMRSKTVVPESYEHVLY